MFNLPLDVAPIPELSNDALAQLQARVESSLQKIIKQNISSKFARTADVLSGLREALTNVDLDDHAACAGAFSAASIPMTEYDQYAPCISKFFDPSPCDYSDVVDLLAPGLPLFMGMSSTTSGKGPKPVPKYLHQLRPVLNQPPSKQGAHGWGSRTDGLACRPIYCGYQRFVEIRGEEPGKPGGADAITRVPCGAVSAVAARARSGFYDFEKDNERLAEPISGITAPWGAALIANYRSMLLAHAVFALAEESVDTLVMTWSTTFVDFVRWIDEEWGTLVDAISSGVLPQFPETGSVYVQIATTFTANQSRADALRKIGPPSQTAVGWALKVWPKLELLTAVCTGTFSRVYSEVRGYIGPDTPVRCPIYGCTEGSVGLAYHDSLPDIVKMLTDNYIEMLEVLPGNEDGDIKPLWQVETDKTYEPVLTTQDGLWRYRTMDAIRVVGFSPKDGIPLIEYKERRNQSMWVAQALVSQADILASIDGISAFDNVEFTTWWDDRSHPPTVGFFIESTPNTRALTSSARDEILKGLIEANINFSSGAERGLPVRPTIRLLAPGSFSDFRSWKGTVNGVGSSQIKLPIITLDTKAQEFLLSKVVAEI